ncbi:ASCH domain-containing protein [Lapidilactobacillus mulanensis]|uniref:ASCH domain-containing protein n=1 Tax=Lapidilactobacillus mulanensis TaxID=2485999 RepID=A0ABW4DP36_9LACO|nr:ASCH domain-containing protein [Lapidilactobacillus mulanensis]
MTDLAVSTYWEAFKKTHPQAGDKYLAWSFGNTAEQADELLALVLAGKKTATSSLYQLYRWTNEPIPQVGDFNIILDGHQQPSCIIQTSQIDVVPYAEVSAEHATLEGEGDLSLDYWHEKHWPFFSEEAKAANFRFSERDPIVCERFVLLAR